MTNSEWLDETIWVEGGLRGEMIVPRKVAWREKTLTVISVGRQWLQEDATHVLVELHDRSRMELTFSHKNGWRIVRYWPPSPPGV